MARQFLLYAFQSYGDCEVEELRGRGQGRTSTYFVVISFIIIKSDDIVCNN